MSKRTSQRIARATLVLACGLTSAAFAADATWLGGTGNFSDGTQWNIGVKPGSVTADTVQIDSGYTFLDQNASNLLTLTMTGGTLSGAHIVDLSDGFTWTGGTIGDGAYINIGGTTAQGIYQATLNAPAAGSITMAGTQIVADQLAWTGGDIQLTSSGYGNVLQSGPTGTLTIAATAGDTLDGGGALFISAPGAINTVGSHVLRQTTLAANGTLNISGGTLDVRGFAGDSGGIYASAFIASDSALVVNDFQLHANANLYSEGTIVMNGVFGIDAAAVAGSAFIDLYGTIAGGQIQAFTGLTLRPGSAIENATIASQGAAPGATLMTTALQPFTVSSSTFTWDSLNWLGAGSIVVVTYNGFANLQNYGTFSFADDQPQGIQFFDPNANDARLDNFGTLAVTGGNTYTIAIPLLSEGTIDVTAGTLNLFGGGTVSDNAALAIASGGTLNFAGQPFTFGNGVSITNAGSLINHGQLSAGSASLVGANLLFDGVELNVRGNLDTNQFTWTSGVLSGAGTTLLKGNATFSNRFGVSGDRLLSTNGYTITLSGDLVYGQDALPAFEGLSTGTILIGPGEGGSSSALQITAATTVGGNNTQTTFDLRSGSSIVGNAGDGNTATLGVGGDSLLHAGVIDVRSGTLAIGASGSGSGSITGQPGTTVDFADNNYDALAGTVIDTTAVRVTSAYLGLLENAVVTAPDGVTILGGSIAVAGSTSFAGTSQIDVIGQGEDTATLAIGPTAFFAAITPHAIDPGVPIHLSQGGTLSVRNATATAGAVDSGSSNGRVSVQNGSLTLVSLSLASNSNVALYSNPAYKSVLRVGAGTLSGASINVDGTFLADTLAVDSSVIFLGDLIGQGRRGTFGRTNTSAALDLSTSIVFGPGGTLSGSVTAGVISPGRETPMVLGGNSAQAPTALDVTGDLTFVNDPDIAVSELNIDFFVDASGNVTNDVVRAGGKLDVAGVLTLRVTGNFDDFPRGGARYYILTATTGEPGDSVNDLITEQDDTGTRVTLFDYFGNSVGTAELGLEFDGVGQDGLYLFNVVPEPASASLLAAATLLLHRRKRSEHR